MLDFRKCLIGFGLVISLGAAPPVDFLQAGLDPAIDPGVDFFAYANGGWFKRNPIPPSEATWGLGDVLREQLYVDLRRIDEQAAATPAPAGSDARKVGDFWATAMDAARADRLGLEPLRARLAEVDAVGDAAGAFALAWAWAPMGIDALFALGVTQDEKNSQEMAVHLTQGGLGLPERDFYFNADPGVARIRTEYRAHLARILGLLGRDPAGAVPAAARVLAFETGLARASRRLEDIRDPLGNYHKMTPAELAGLTPGLDWAGRLASWNLRPATVIVGQPEFFAALHDLLAVTDPAVLRDYLRCHLVDGYADSLSQPFQDEAFRFHGQVLSGQKQPRERWKRVLDAQEGAMGMVLGKLFVRDHFPETAKRRYTDLVEAIRAAYRARIARLDWMGPATKARAQAKLAAVTAKVGYPEKWKDCSALEVGCDSYCANMLRAARWRFDQMLARYGKPVDRSEWHMTPQTDNAYYSPPNNEIVLPAAGLMIPGMADADLDDAVVYGFAGASTIGHEITHGFDDQGRQFDAAGNLTDWWTPEDAAGFQVRAEGLVRQFDAFEPLPGLHINGKAALGENIADFGGLLLGLDAFRRTGQYRKGARIGGLTPLQRFFLGYALSWQEQEREEQLRHQLLSDVHAPARWRVLGPLSNIPEFYEAFGIKEGQPMWRPEAERIHIW